MTPRFNKNIINLIKEELIDQCNYPPLYVLKLDTEKKLVSICAYCDKQKIETNKWLNVGYTTSHGVCQSCYDRLNDSLG